MGIFRPTALKNRVTEITPEFLKGLGVRALLLDVDNTLATYTSHTPTPGAVEWVRAMEAAGFQMIIISNNYKKAYRYHAEEKSEVYRLYLRLLLVTDYICGMTDSYAKRLYQELNAIMA